MSLERQELHCHACRRYVQFTLDVSINGNHVLECPNCGHEHCRVVCDGRITDIRWDQRNGPTVRVPTTYITSTILSTYTTCNSASSALYFSWANTGTNA